MEIEEIGIMVKTLISNNIYTFSSELHNKDVVIYGTSAGAVKMYKRLKLNNVNIIAFTDSFADENDSNTFIGLPVISLRQLQEMAHDVSVVLGTKVIKYMRQIIGMLNDMGIYDVYADNCFYTAGDYSIEDMKKIIDKNKMKIDFVYQALADEESRRVFLNLLYYRITNDIRLLELSYEKRHPQYFPNPTDQIFTFGDDEVFVDAGAYDGNTSLEFVTQVNHKYKHIYAFEPDSLMFSIVKEMLKVKKLRNFNVYQAGLYNKKSKMGFCEDPLTGSSSISETNNSSIDTVSLDELLFDEGIKITYIKMDIEGAEAEAIDGSTKIINRDHPKMAISIYHKENDLWELPYKILTEYSNYELYVRHYTDITTETICYAVPRNGGCDGR